MSTEEPRVPSQVKKAAKQARAIVEEQRAAREKAESDAVAAAAAAAAGPGEPTPPADPPPAAPAAAAPPPAPPADDFEHKYSVLQGRFVSETSALRDENARMRADIEALKKQPAAPAAPPPPSLITEDEIAEYTAPLTDYIRRVARSELAPVIEERIGDLRKTVDSTARATSALTQEQMMAALTKAMPNWETQNNDQTFVAWLQNKDPLSGIQLHKLLQDAWNRFDADRFTRIFKAWPGYKDAAAPPPPPAAIEPRPTAAAFAAPGTGGAPPSSEPRQQTKKIYAKAEVDDFFLRKQRNNKFSKMTDEEANKMRADITLASIEGRVQ